MLGPDHYDHLPQRQGNTVSPEEIVADARRHRRTALDEASGKRLLQSVSIPVPRGLATEIAAEGGKTGAVYRMRLTAFSARV